MHTISGNIVAFPRKHARPGLPLTEHGETTFAPSVTPDLASLLQTTLITERLLELFDQHVRRIVPHDGYEFSHGPLGIHIRNSGPGAARMSRAITLDGQAIGILTLVRQREFARAEQLAFQHLLPQLVYPLRNALLYHEALRAARTDALTGIGNRAGLQVQLQREWDLARRNGSPFSVIVIDLDHFKDINDTHGHDSGDGVLRAAAAILSRSVRGGDIVFRFGGEEFVALLSNTPLAGAVRLAERIRKGIAKTECLTLRGPIKVTASLGVASLKPRESAEQLLRRADQALYRAKAEGRNCVEMDE